MARLVYTHEELLADHPYASRQEEAGYRLHGGFDADGRYISPRTLYRWPAIRAWEAAARARGVEIIDSSQSLLARGNYPNTEQQGFLLANGLGQTFWNSLSITGLLEARGKILTLGPCADFQEIVEGDISETATGHLNKGLLLAHGLDEAGNPESGEGGHDSMWFAVRDMLFGKHAYPHATVPSSVGRPQNGRAFPQLPENHENWILLLMNLLMVEIRAEAFFGFCTHVMRDPRNFRDRRDIAAHAADLVDRIRDDEQPHVGYLTVVMSELRSFTFKGADGSRIAGKQIIDPVWKAMVQWHSVANFDWDRAEKRKELEALLGTRPNGAELVRKFHALEQKEAA